MLLERRQVFVLALIATIAFVYFMVFFICPGSSCFGGPTIATTPYSSDVAAFVNGERVEHDFSPEVLDRRRNIDINDGDVFVFIRVQKTGSSFFDFTLLYTLAVDPPCLCERNKRCQCVNHDKKLWLFTGKSSGWGCGLHADYTEHTACLDEWFRKRNDFRRRRYHYITLIRNPVNRFISEWRHVVRGATWRGALLKCNGRRATLEELPYCYEGKSWRNVSFDEFTSCPHNLAFNRMTRMFADLTKVNCYNRSHLDPDEVDRVMLESAKEDLANFAYFAILEHPRESQFLFERTFGVNFTLHFHERETNTEGLQITDEMRQMAVDRNQLDISLFQFGRDLFWKRVAEMERLLGYTVEDYFTRYRREEVHNLKPNLVRKRLT